MLQLRKLDITELPLKTIATMTEVELESWCKQNQLNRMGSWLLPQLVAAFGSWTLAKTAGKPDVKATLKHNCEASLENQACWRLSRVPRSVLLTKQIALADYATFTPLILAGFKRMQGVPYESWRGCEGLEYVVEPKLLEAISVVCADLGSERLLEIRQKGLVWRSGTQKGTMKRAESTWSLTGIQDTELGHLPKLTQSMLTQIWLAHPSNRSSMMILDPNNWDLMPEPLITNTLFAKPVLQEAALLETTNKKATQLEPEKLLPWM